MLQLISVASVIYYIFFKFLIKILDSCTLVSKDSLQTAYQCHLALNYGHIIYNIIYVYKSGLDHQIQHLYSVYYNQLLSIPFSSVGTQIFYSYSYVTAALFISLHACCLPISCIPQNLLAKGCVKAICFLICRTDVHLKKNNNKLECSWSLNMQKLCVHNGERQQLHSLTAYPTCFAAHTVKQVVPCLQCHLNINYFEH